MKSQYRRRHLSVSVVVASTIVLWSAHHLYSQVICFEGIGFPESDAAPWARVGTSNAQRLINDGLFCQLVSPGQFDGYTRSPAEFTGSRRWFVTWRGMSDAPSSELGTTPNGLSTSSSTTPVLFAFTVTADEVRFLRDNPLALEFYIGIQPGMLHSYYLELDNQALSYSWYIDGVVANAGQFPSPFPDTSGQITWWARRFMNQQPQNAKWDYVRYGVIPVSHSGDFDSNGVVDLNDLYYFLDCLLTAPEYDNSGPGCRFADMNSDGRVNGADIQLFCRAMVGS